MRWLSILALLVGVLVLASNAVAADPELGKTIYAKKCAGCHGPDGKGNPKMAEKLKVTIPDLAKASTKSEPELLKLISDGKKPMPTFSKTLSKDELNAVAHYAKSLAGGQPGK